MLYIKDDPVGIDEVIDRLQKTFHDPLNTKWGPTDVYGRVYKNTKGNKTVLETYVGNKEYRPILFSEGNKVFFLQGDRPDLNLGSAINDLYAVFIVNLSFELERQDEEQHQFVTDLLSQDYGDELKGLVYGLNNINRLFNETYELGNFKVVDIHPYHVFAVKLRVDYSLTEYNC